MSKTKTPQQLLAQNERLRRRLARAEKTLKAIQTGAADALVVSGPDGDRIYTLSDAARPYRVLVEEMSEGAVTLTMNGMILYSNHRFAEMIGAHPEALIGHFLGDLLVEADQPVVEHLIRQGFKGSFKGTVHLCPRHGSTVPVEISVRRIVHDGNRYLSAVVMDISDREQKALEKEKLIHDLGKRVKELTVLHRAARVLQSKAETAGQVLQEIADLLPSAYQFTDQSAARITLGELEARTGNFVPTHWKQEAPFTLSDGTPGLVQVVYLTRVRPEDEGPFLAEERNVLDSVAEMLKTYFEKARAERALGASQDKFKISVENMLDGFAILSSVRDAAGKLVDFKYEYINEAGCRLNRARREDIVGKHLLEFLPRHDDSGLFDAYRRVVETGEPLAKESLTYEDVYDSRLLTRASDIRATKLGDGFTVSWRDITNRIRGQQTVREQAQLLESTHEAIILRDLDSVIRYWNHGAEEMYGWTAQQARAQVSYSLLTTRFPQALEEIEEVVCNTGRWDGELVHRRKNGTEIVVASRWALLKDEQGNPAAFLEINSDITERKRAEDELRHLNAELEHRVQERTAELEEANVELETEISERQEVENELGRRNRELTVLYDVNRASMQSMELDERLENSLKATMQVLNVQRGAIFLLDAELDRLVLRAHRGYTSVAEIEHLKLNEGAVGRALAEKKPIVLNLPQYPTERLTSFALRENLQTIAALPLVARDRLVGAMSLSFGEPREFPPEEMELLATLGQYLGLSVRNSQLYEALEDELAKRKQLQQELEQERSQWKAMVESMLDAVTLADAQGRATYMNPAYTRLVERQIQKDLDVEGHPAFYQLYRPDGSLFTPEDLPLQRAALFGVEQRNVEIVQRTLSGGERIAIWNAAPLRAADGSLTGAVAVGRDITEQRAAERAIQQLNKDLQQHAFQLELANQELEAFSYSVSHDLRTPLYSIRQFADLLLEEYGAQLPEQGRKYIDLVSGNTSYMIDLVTSLLDFSRTSRASLRRAQVEPGRVARVVKEELATVQKDRQVEWVVGEMPPCEADPVLFKQVYANLLSNALKFTRQRPAARIEIGCIEDDGNVAYYVRDNGVGFNAAQADRLFGVFQRYHHSEEYEGNGVGLAIVARIVRRHGGRIWAESQVNQGATFYFTIGTPALAGGARD